MDPNELLRIIATLAGAAVNMPSPMSIDEARGQLWSIFSMLNTFLPEIERKAKQTAEEAARAKSS